ncbi:MAG: hypothetical protein QF441_10435 [Bacteriovoracaceae bacterium]|jgi:hypothetical protein|nr:hypothetical protein [Halobacteriovoraceae bacterium]MDP7321017.1 hypothetical protein [Bacteriovoracaceae bacterium]
MIKFIIIFLFSLPLAMAQLPGQAFEDDEDLNIGGDIFQDFNEDLEAQQVMEDERFYRYSRFFGVNLGLGFTTFTDNRGLAYNDNHPTFSFSLLYFINFQNAIILGVEYSKHTMLIDTYVNGSPNQIIGAVETNMTRPFIGFRYYLDTSDLGTAITYSNPYFVGRMEYWYQTNVFAERENLSDQSGGGLGTGVGFGLEFPIELKKRYINVEFLYHRVNFFDKFTRDYRQIPDDPNRTDDEGNILISEYGFDDLRGDVLSLVINYHISW